ncbi:MAG: hypothetical protein AB1668_03060 [Nanoarchaeota archaeon]
MKLEEQWAELLSLLFLVVGFILSILLQNPYLSYITVLLGGFLAARGYYVKRYEEPILPFILMILGFLIGYLVGSFWANRLLVLLFFALGFALSYYLHLKKILVIFKSEGFFK